MIVDYDATSEKYVLDFNGTTTFTKNKYGIEFTKSFVDNDKGNIVIKNMYVIGENNKTFMDKIKYSVKMMKYIWRG